MGLWDKLFGKKYLSWDEYQGRMDDLEQQLWQRKATTRKKLMLPQGLQKSTKEDRFHLR